jgi:hypothetical protein
MEFLRRHAFLIVCALVAVGGIAAGAVYLNRMPSVLDEMRTVQALHEDLQHLQPINDTFLIREQERIDAVAEDLRRTLDEARKLTPYAQLVEGFFPAMELHKERDFRDRYIAELDRMMRKLVGIQEAPPGQPIQGRPATSDHIDMMKDVIAREEALRTQGRSISDVPGLEEAPLPAGPSWTPGWVLTEAGARTDAVARAHMDQAQRIRCYAISPFDRTLKVDATGRSPEVASLEIEATVIPTGTMERPPAKALWRAQLGIWIQWDVVNAIAALNEEAAERYRSEHHGDQDRRSPWVGLLPVKEVVSIRTSDYILASDDLFAVPKAEGFGASAPPSSQLGVFTHSASNSEYEVLQFSVKAVVDQRYILPLIGRISEGRFHTPVRVTYAALPPNRKMEGKIYGAGPVVMAIIDFETIMPGAFFRRWMPKDILEELQVAAPDDAEIDGG